MDYERIYSAFIQDRLKKQPSKPSYFERHHILPRSLGGSDAPSNIIRLTPEDHFFAHLLLAKIHGGEMWAPVAFMVGGSRKDYKPTQSRKNHGWAARALAKAKSGDGAYQFDRTIYQLVHRDGRRWSGLQSQMVSDLGMHKTSANQLVKKKARSSKGWSLLEIGAYDQSGSNHPMYRKDVHRFRHVDGREFVGTQFELHKAHGLTKPAVHNLVSGKAKVWNGWHLEGTEIPTFGRSARWQKFRHAPSAT